MGQRYQPVFGGRRATTARPGPFRRTAIAAVAVAALAAAAFVVARRPDQTPPRLPDPPRAFLGFDPSHEADPPGAAPAAPVATHRRSSRARDAGTICGLGPMPAPVDGQEGSSIPPSQHVDASRRLESALVNAADPRARAAGRLLRLDALRDDASDAADATAMQTVAELAADAAQSADPAVYAAAMAACARKAGEAPAACGALNANRWSSLEPTNAAPWLRLAQEARAAGDGAALAADVYQASIARRIDWHDADLALAAFQAIPSDASPLARTLDAHDIARASDGWAWPAYGGLVDFCAQGADANRDQTCEAVASMLLRPEARAAESRLGARLGHTLGWPASRLEALRLQRDALAQAQESAPSDEQAWDCASADRLQARILRRQRLGETGALRLQLAEAGMDIDAEVARLRASRAGRVARVEAAGDATP
ncbi:MAG TPA: hypothetical protein VIN75_09265 [Burkholderiaceae bacterium]